MVDDETEGVIRKIRDIGNRVKTPSRRVETCRDDFRGIINLTKLTNHDRLISQPSCSPLYASDILTESHSNPVIYSGGPVRFVQRILPSPFIFTMRTVAYLQY